jgi:hypothetical protein
MQAAKLKIISHTTCLNKIQNYFRQTVSLQHNLMCSIANPFILATHVSTDLFILLNDNIKHVKCNLKKYII